MIELTEALIHKIYENTRHIKFFPTDKFSVVHSHGSWAPIMKNGHMIMKGRYITDVDYTNYVRIAAEQDPSNPSIFIIENAEKQRIYKEIVRVLKAVKKLGHVHFTSLFAGTDPRFQFPYTISKTGTITNYDPVALKRQIGDLLANGTMTEMEHAKIDSLIKPAPTLMEFYNLYIEFIENMGELHWTYDEIMKNKKTYRGLETSITNQLDRIQALGSVGISAAPFVFGFIIKIDDGVYIPVDLSLVFYTPKPTCEEKLDKILRVSVVTTHASHNEEKLFDDCINLINERTRTTDNIAIYDGLFKNYAQYKYGKMLKRLRTILTHKMFGEMSEKELAPHDKRFLGRVRKEIGEVFNEPTISALNHLKNRLETTQKIIKSDFEPVPVYKGLVLDLLKDIWQYTEYNRNFSNETLLRICQHLKKPAANKTALLKELSDLKVEMFQYINARIKPYWTKYYDEVRRFFHFPSTLFAI